jgi:aminoglycoside 6'-N-acetyltransferase
MNPQNIHFKTLDEDDFQLLFKWMNLDFVSRWYDKRKFIYDDVEREYSMRLKEDTPIESFMVYYGETPIGYVHDFRVYDYPEYALEVLVERETYAMDMFIGDREYIGRGLGPAIIRKFLNEVVFQKEDCNICIVGLEKDNHAAIRAYEKVGFTYLKTIQSVGSPEPEYIMQIHKDQHGVTEGFL